MEQRNNDELVKQSDAQNQKQHNPQSSANSFSHLSQVNKNKLMIIQRVKLAEKQASSADHALKKEASDAQPPHTQSQSQRNLGKRKITNGFLLKRPNEELDLVVLSRVKCEELNDWSNLLFCDKPEVGKLMLCLPFEEKCAVYGLTLEVFERLLKSDIAHPSQPHTLHKSSHQGDKGTNGVSPNQHAIIEQFMEHTPDYSKVEDYGKSFVDGLPDFLASDILKLLHDRLFFGKYIL